ncbi:MAG TPA: hypothetical protein VL337_00580 [Acidimicrobiales bacterium]|nr:hypothetical protein [Acidimicrobiales bacterium]
MSTTRQAEDARKRHQVEVARLQERNRRRMVVAAVVIAALVVLVVALAAH